MSLDNWNKGCSIRREIDKPNPEKGLLCQRAGSPTSGKFEEQAGCRDGGPGPHRCVRACAGPREQMQRRLERVKTGTQAESSRTAELGGLRQGKMSARETEDNQGHEDAPRRRLYRVRRVGPVQQGQRQKKWTCSKSSSALSRIMKFHRSAFLTISYVQGCVCIVLLSLKTGDSVPLHMVTQPEI